VLSGRHGSIVAKVISLRRSNESREADSSLRCECINVRSAMAVSQKSSQLELVKLDWIAFIDAAPEIYRLVCRRFSHLRSLAPRGLPRPVQASHSFRALNPLPPGDLLFPSTIETTAPARCASRL
jgi:hypothetical protein